MPEKIMNNQKKKIKIKKHQKKKKNLIDIAIKE
jgi:hypothetical protein